MMNKKMLRTPVALMMLIVLLLPVIANAAQYCPGCGNVIQSSYNFCPFCARDLRGDAAAEAARTAATAAPANSHTSNRGVARGMAINALATRYGPSTSYREPGTFLMAGQYVDIISMTEHKGTTWVQCEIPYGGTMHRFYTGLKRFDSTTIDFDLVRTESGDRKPAYVIDNSKNQFRDGPGTRYGICKIDPKNADGYFDDVWVLYVENGWAQVEFRFPEKTWRAWTKTSNIVYSTYTHNGY